jgi:hypothetical protein
MGGQCHTTLCNACYPKRAEALDVRIVCLHFLMQLVPGFIPACAGATLRNSTSVPVSRVHPCVCRGLTAPADSRQLIVNPRQPLQARCRAMERRRVAPHSGTTQRTNARREPHPPRRF